MIWQDFAVAGCGPGASSGVGVPASGVDVYGEKAVAKLSPCARHFGAAFVPRPGLVPTSLWFAPPSISNLNPLQAALRCSRWIFCLFMSAGDAIFESRRPGSITLRRSRLCRLDVVPSGYARSPRHLRKLVYPNMRFCARLLVGHHGTRRLSSVWRFLVRCLPRTREFRKHLTIGTSPALALTRGCAASSDSMPLTLTTAY